MFFGYIVDAVQDLWRLLRRQSLPEGHIDRYAIFVIVIAWTCMASVAFGFGVLWADEVGLWEQPVVAAALFLSWPVIAGGGSLLTYRRIHRR